MLRDVAPHSHHGQQCEGDACEHEGLAAQPVTQVTDQGGEEEAQEGVGHKAVEAGPAHHIRVGGLGGGGGG